MESIKNIWKGTNKNDKQDFGISLIVIGLAALFIIYYSLGLNSDNNSSINHQEPLSDTIISNENILAIEEVVVAEKTYLSIKAKDKNGEYNSNKDFDQNQRTQKNEKQEPRDSSSITLKNTLLKTMISDSVLVDSDTKTVVTIDTLRTIPNDSLTAIAEMGVENKKITKGPSSKDCIILVGSYLKSPNADRMYKRLVSDGHVNAFTTKNNDYTRVGIYTSCDAEKLQLNLSKIRSRYASDAIHLIEK